MNPFRPIHKVIDALKTLIPDEYENKTDLIYELEEIKSSASYAAPGLTGMLWDRLCEALETLGEPGQDKWKQDIKDLISSKTDYRTILGE